MTPIFITIPDTQGTIHYIRIVDILYIAQYTEENIYGGKTEVQHDLNGRTCSLYTLIPASEIHTQMQEIQEKSWGFDIFNLGDE